MARRSLSSPARRSRRHSRRAQQSRLWHWSLTGLAIVGVGSSVVGALWAIRVGYLLVVNPGALPWVSQVFPEWQPPDYRQQQSQTWQEVQRQLAAHGQQAGAPIRIDPTATETTLATALPIADWLVPILVSEPNCTAACDRLVALHVYRPLQSTGLSLQPSDQLYPVAQMTMPTLSSTAVLTPLHQAIGMEVGRDRPLPLSVVQRLPGTVPDLAHWFVVSHHLEQDGQQLQYGLIVPYSIVEAGFLPTLTWVSPADALPAGIASTAGLPGGEGDTSTSNPARPPEFMVEVDHTVGLATRLQLYRWVAAPDWPIAGRFEQVELTPVVDHADYQAAIALAQGELWSLAAQRWDQVPAAAWSNLAATAAAQSSQAESAIAAIQATLAAQHHLIRLHAQRLSTQAAQQWSSPSQQILAQLMDGQWQTARQTLQAAPAQATIQTTIRTMLQQQDLPVRSRLQAALQVSPQTIEAQVWLAVLIALQQNETQAIAQLQSRSSSPQTTTAYLRQMLAQLHAQDSTRTAAVTPAAAISTPANRFIGIARPVSTITPSQWQPLPGQTITATSGIEVEIIQRHDGQQWRTSNLGNLPVGTAGADLGLTTSTSLQLWQAGDRWQSVAVQGFRQQGERLYLLTPGSPASPLTAPALAMTPNALSWPAAAPTQSLEAFSQQTPEPAATLLQALWQTLRQGAYVVDLPTEPRDRLLSQFGGSRIQPLQSPEDERLWLVWLRGDTVQQSAYATDRSRQIQPDDEYVVVVEATGRVVYSNLTQPEEQVRAIAQRDQVPFLVLETPDSYRLVSLVP